jgi:hypothetical protein
MPAVRTTAGRIGDHDSEGIIEMLRREFGLLLLGALVVPVTARAQERLEERREDRREERRDEAEDECARLRREDRILHERLERERDRPDRERLEREIRDTQEQMERVCRR